jgi:hypothetical protein
MRTSVNVSIGFPSGLRTHMDAEYARTQIATCRTRKDMVAWVSTHIGEPVTGKVSRRIIETVQESLTRNRRADAAAFVLAYAMADANELVAMLRRQGVLRASRYKFNPGGPREVVGLLLLLKEELRLLDADVRYLTSLRALYLVADRAERIRRQLLARLKSRRGTALKTLLVVGNQVFAHGHQQDIEAPSHEIEHYSAEDISDAVSRVISLYREEFGTQARDWVYTDPQALSESNATYSQDLYDALRLNELIKAETLLDGLPYEAEVAGGGVVIRSIDPTIEKSVRLGYMQMESQVITRQQELRKVWSEGGEPGSLAKLCELFFEKGLNRLATFRPKPLPRMALAIPNAPALFEVFADERYFKEDVLSVVQLGTNSFDDPGLEPFEIAPGVRSIDLFKVNRLFAVITYAMQDAISKQDPAMHRTLALHSSVVAMPQPRFMELLANVLTREVAERVFELLKFDTSRDHVDLQYTPFIVAGDHIVAAPALVAASNLVRNAACANHLQENRIKGVDPMQRAVVDALKDAGFVVAEEVGLQRQDHDVDILAYRDGCLYAFECKNAYHPCNVHEMRNSFDHIQKAGRQLTLRQAWLAQSSNLSTLFAKLGWTVPPPHTIRTGILIANRVFTGASVGGHPVRQAHEFINVIARGEVRSIDGTVYAIWNGDAFHTDDLDCYLGSGGLVADHFEVLEPINYDYNFDGVVLRFESWRMNPKDQKDAIERRYRVKAPEPA